MGFKNVKQALFESVKQSHKTDLNSILMGVKVASSDLTTSTTYNEGKTVYISEPGLYKLVFASRLETAEAFQGWVCEEVLPSISAAEA